MSGTDDDQSRQDAELERDELERVQKVRIGLRKLGRPQRADDEEAKAAARVLRRHMQRRSRALATPTRRRALDHYVASCDARVLRDLGRGRSQRRGSNRFLGVRHPQATLVQLAEQIRNPAYRYQK